MTGTHEDERPAIAGFVALNPQARLESLRARGVPAASLCDYADACDRLMMTDVSAAVAASEALVATAAQLADPHALARTRRSRAAALAASGAFAESLSLAQVARADALRDGAKIEAARCLTVQMQPLLVTGRAPEALAAGSAARDELNALGERTLAARVEINLGNIHKALGNPTAALSALDAAASQLGSQPDLAAHVENARGESLFLLDRFVEARDAFQKALTHFTVSGGMAAAVVEGNLADLASRQGQYQEALERFAHARQLLGDAPSAHAARMLVEEGEVFEMLGIPEIASARYTTGQQLFEKLSMAYEALRALVGHGRVLESSGEPEAGAARFADAAIRAQTLGNETERSHALLQRASTLARIGRLGEARESLASVATASLVAPFDRTMAHFHTAVVAERSGALASALSEVDSALEHAAVAGIPPMQADALALRATLLRRSRRPRDAAHDARRAVTIIERMRGSLQAERTRAGLLGRRMLAYEELVASLLDDGSPEATAEAFSVAEQAKSRALLDRMRQALGDATTPISGRRGEELSALIARLDALYSRAATDAKKGTRHGLPEAIRAEIASVDEQIGAIEAEAAGSATGAARLVAPVADGRRPQLPTGTAMLAYYRTNGQWMAFVTTRDSTTAVRLGCDDATLCDAIGRLGFQLRRGLRESCALRPKLISDATTALARVADLVWTPLAPHIAGIERVIVVPHGPLHTLPFHALITNGRFVAHAHTISYAPSANVWANLVARSSAQSAPMNTRVVGVPDPAAPAIEGEALRVAEFVGDHTPLIGEQATVARVKQLLVEADRIHLACHGFFLPEAPRASGLKLADGWLTARDIAALPRTPSVVVLSGCETAATAIRGGDELLGLSGAFLGNSTNQLLATLWPVQDGHAAEAMACFYGLSTAATSVHAASAYRHLTLDLMERTPHPAHWAPFALIGA
jgi:tetratricopeptide (TPR) repeat protein